MEKIAKNIDALKILENDMTRVGTQGTCFNSFSFISINSMEEHQQNAQDYGIELNAAEFRQVMKELI